MGDKVFINGRSAIHAGSAGKSMAFPDVNLCPPTPPAGPVPLPLPNVAQAMDLQGGAESVLIEGNPVAKKSSFFAKSTGNEAAQSTGGGVVTAVVQGKAYFVSYSVDVSIEGEEAPRHLDMMTHNHAGQSPPNAAVGTYLGMMDPAAVGPASDPPKPRKDDGKPQDIEFYLDHIDNSPAAGLDALHLVSDDGKYDQKLSASAAAPKGGLLWLKFEKVLPAKSYSLYIVQGDEEIALFEHVAFVNIRDHAAGDEKLPPPKPATAPAEADEGDGDGDDADASAEAPDYPEDWYDPSSWEWK
jgi:hypothetical protein